MDAPEEIAVTRPSLRLGGQSGTSALRFGGQIDEVRVFQGSLAPSAMTDLAAAPSPCAPLKVQLLTPANNSAYNAPATIELTAIATNTIGPVSKIEYLNGSTVVGTVYASGATFAWTDVGPGTYSLSAKVYDSVSGTSATSSPITVTVTAVASAMAASVHVVVAATAAPSTTIVNAWADSDDAAVAAPVYYAAPNYRFLWRPLTAGTHTLTIRLQDSTGLWKAMPPVTVNMVPGSPSTVYYYNDAAGSPIAGTDPNGTLLWDGSYYPYGQRFNEEDGNTKNGLWYTGKPVEDSTGLSYFGARWYNPRIGRFYSTDPKGFNEGNPLSFNRYAFANNNPYKFLDPDGKSAAFVFGLLAVGGAVWMIHELVTVPTPAPGAHPDAIQETIGPWDIAGIVGGARALFGLAARSTVLEVETATIRGTNAAGELTSRGHFRKGTQASMWENAEPGPSAGRLCPSCGKEVHVPPNSGSARDWDGSHNPSWTNREFPANASRKEVLDNYNTGSSLECVSCNRSGQANDSRFGN
jgi:RHS repeat-associated protein